MDKRSIPEGTRRAQVQCPACNNLLTPPRPHSCGRGELSMAAIEQDLAAIAAYLREQGLLPRPAEGQAAS